MYNRYQGNSGRVERVPDAPQPVREPASTAPASKRANLLFSFMMIYLEVSILQKRL